MLRRSKKNEKSNKPSFVKEEIVGKVSLTRDGYGFVMTEGRDNDVFVTAHHLRGALNNDIVKVVTTKAKGYDKDGKPKRIEGTVVEIIERSKLPHIGILNIVGRTAWAIIESRSMPYDIRIPMEELDRYFGKKQWKASKLNGLQIAVTINDWPRREPAPFGRIYDVLGAPGENDTEMHSILAQFGLPYKFEDEVEAAADGISEVITEKEIKERRDFRDVTTITIDPADAKDFDDAISYRKLENGNIEVGVHIADVTHYVTPGSLIDKVAYERATSVYLVDRTVPMLPEKLSNKLCSLRPNEEKLCFSAVFEMDAEAKVLNHWFGRTVIKSNHRFSYEEAQAVIDTKEGPFSEEVLALQNIAAILRDNRYSSGAVMFERPEMKVEIDEKGRPISVYQKITKEANWLIEEFMLLANKSVAESIGKVRKNVTAKTFVYRIHEDPNGEKVESLRKFVKLFGYNLGSPANRSTANNNENDEPALTGKKLSKALNNLLSSIKGKPEESTIEMLALRSMARARYSTDNLGHYGLAFPHYTHFTSPIRRYPDMMVHRLLALYLDNQSSQDKSMYEEMCEHSSEREQVAVEAERASIKYKLVEFMQDKVGMVFDGTISGLKDWGMYVEIEPTKVEGMVPVRDMRDDFYEFDEDTYSLIGRSSGVRYTLGDKVKVKVVRASLEQKIIDYQLVDDQEIE